MTGAASGGASGGVTGRTTAEESNDASSPGQAGFADAVTQVNPAGIPANKPPQIPNVVGLQPVARDGMATTYSATDLRLQRPVTLSVFSPLTDEAARSRFNDDTKKLGRLSAHPNVATVYDAGFTDDGRPFLVSEALAADPTSSSQTNANMIDSTQATGETLAARLATSGPMPWPEAVDVVLQLCAGLGQAHRAGILHRELSPAAAVLISSTPKLINFRTSADQSDRAPEPTPAALLHRAPETLGKSGPAVWNERTDLYSLGSILYQLVDGNAPFWRPGDDSPEAVQLRIIHEKPPKLEQELVPAPLAVFITAALSKDPLDRPQTADEFAHELRLIREGRTTDSTQSVLHGTTGSMPLAPQALSLSTEATGTTPPAAVAPAPIDPRWAPPSGPQDPAGSPVPPGNSPPGSNRDSTAVYSTPMWATEDQHHVSDEPNRSAQLLDVDNRSAEDAPRSNAFMAAVALIALGIIGLGAVVAISSLGGNDEEAAPLLPDPNAPATEVEIETEAGSLVGAVADSDVMQDDAMEEGAPATTVAPAQPTETTETTVIRIPIPNLVGLKVETATQQLSDAGFEVVVVSRTSVTATAGTVAQQKPDPGARVSLPLTVTLYIPKVSNLPDMIGRTADSVCLELQALSLSCTRTMQFSATAPIGTVISSDPVGGAFFSDGSTVNLVVSRGPVTNVPVPSVTGLSREDAEATLRAAGFIRISFNEATSENVDVGLAIGSSPGATNLLATDQPVVVTISTGQPAKARLPNVVGQDQAAAETQLTTLGYTVTIEMVDLAAGDVNIGKVTAMNPPADSEVSAGSPIVLSVGQLMPAESTTTTTAPGSTTSEPASSTSTTDPMSETTTTSDSTGSETSASTTTP